MADPPSPDHNVNKTNQFITGLIKCLQEKRADGIRLGGHIGQFLNCLQSNDTALNIPMQHFCAYLQFDVSFNVCLQANI